MATVKRGSSTTATTRRRAAARKAEQAQPNGNPTRDPRTVAEPNVEAIRARAYELFLARGAVHGHDLADWFQAERELRTARAS
ncbi:MAG TPA: DUF2934 domain-containing protein [Candidatus Binataceae bacterium]|jgi:hypothetical protein|nr:DUF2934 domain-containing protein [Candidatus Binataceae bacterium]